MCSQQQRYSFVDLLELTFVMQPMAMRTQSAHRVRSRGDTVYTCTTTKIAEAQNVRSTSGPDVTQARQWTLSTRARRDQVSIDVQLSRVHFISAE